MVTVYMLSVIHKNPVMAMENTQVISDRTQETPGEREKVLQADDVT